ncbi:MAG: 1-deoxy-D-xylulose-5-phosphate synthase N-terminal domain-containing protein [Enterocloster bolteae]
MAEFDELRRTRGLSGFPKRKESPYDSFDTGPQLHLHIRGAGNRPGARYQR